MRRHARTIIGGSDDGERLLDYLIRRFTYHTATEWAVLIEAGHLLLNESTADADAYLHSGDQLEYCFPDMAEPDADLSYRILQRNDAWLIIDKPGNLPCHPAGGYFNHTLWALLRRDFPDEDLCFINRLDRETSGIVLVARNKAASAVLSRQFARQQVSKEYLVLVEGMFPERLDAAGALVADEGSAVRKKRKFLPAQPGEPAEVSTLFRLLGHRPSGISVVHAFPRTGKLHQIRATLCGLGYPVVGDKIYGVDDTIFLRFVEQGLTHEDLAKLRLSRQALHALSLQFADPVSGEIVRAEAPVPGDIMGLTGQISLRSLPNEPNDCWLQYSRDC